MPKNLIKKMTFGKIQKPNFNSQLEFSRFSLIGQAWHEKTREKIMGVVAKKHGEHGFSQFETF